MKNVERTIERYNLIKPGDVVGVACSGGKDSMSLLHFLHSISKAKGFTVCAITIDHCLRENSRADADFVVSYCQKNGIKVFMYKINAAKLSKDKGMTIEQGARECRYKIFKSMLDKGNVTKIALGHHMQDQTETILLNIFRGSGITGASGMDVIRDGVYIRPLLKSGKAEIVAYIAANDIPYVEDESNKENDYARNYIRNMIMPLVRAKWSNADSVISSFGDLCKQDDDYIVSTIHDDSVIYENTGTVRIPTSYFVYPASVKYRLLQKAFKHIGVTSNIERKHMVIINGLALEGENGNRINLPNKIVVIKEYDYITITNRGFAVAQKTWAVERGKIDIPNWGVINMQMLRKFEVGQCTHIIDYNKVPKNAVWRFRKDGDVFEKFGGGTKKLAEYLIDQKIPSRLRHFIPVLAADDQVLVIAGVEISNKVKIDKNTKTAWGIDAIRF